MLAFLSQVQQLRVLLFYDLASSKRYDTLVIKIIRWSLKFDNLGRLH